MAEPRRLREARERPHPRREVAARAVHLDGPPHARRPEEHERERDELGDEGECEQRLLARETRRVEPIRLAAEEHERERRDDARREPAGHRAALDVLASLEHGRGRVHRTSRAQRPRRPRTPTEF